MSVVWDDFVGMDHGSPLRDLVALELLHFDPAFLHLGLVLVAGHLSAQSPRTFTEGTSQRLACIRHADVIATLSNELRRLPPSTFPRPAAAGHQRPTRTTTHRRAWRRRLARVGPAPKRYRAERVAHFAHYRAST